MSTAFLPFEPQQTQERLRNHAAVVRALLDELDRIAPPLGEGGSARIQGCGAAQLAEEVARLGCELLECAAAMAGENVSSERVTSSAVRRLRKENDRSITARPATK